MEILVVAATEEEIKPFMLLHPTAHFLITGVGTAATTYSHTRRLNQADYDFVIQAGVCGAFDKGLELGSTVKIVRDTFGHSGVWEGKQFFLLEERSLRNPGFPFTEGWLVNAHSIIQHIHLPGVDAITVDLVSDDPLFNELTCSKFSAQIESMEGAAFHFVCLMENIPFVQLRAVSNYVGQRNKEKWDLQKAIENLNHYLGIVYKNLLK